MFDARKLRAFREASGFTTDELAEKLNIKQTAYSRYENGTAQPNATALKLIADALDKELDDFYS